MNMQDRVQELLDLTGVKLNGPNPWDIQVHNDRLYRRVLTQGSLGLGEAYMDDAWDCERIDELVTRLLRNDIRGHMRKRWPQMAIVLASVLLNRQSERRAFKVGEQHYDVGNDLYTAMLDRRLTYTCGYWKEATTLDEAQEAKLDLTCRKIGLKQGDRVLDIGCGWGSFAASRRSAWCHRGGRDRSKEQKTLGDEMQGVACGDRLQDREVNETFNHCLTRDDRACGLQKLSRVF